MKSIRLYKQGSIDLVDLKFEDIPIPEPKGNEIRIKIEASSVCHTDLHIIEGDLPLKKKPISAAPLKSSTVPFPLYDTNTFSRSG